MYVCLFVVNGYRANDPVEILRQMFCRLQVVYVVVSVLKTRELTLLNVAIYIHFSFHKLYMF